MSRMILKDVRGSWRVLPAPLMEQWRHYQWLRVPLAGRYVLSLDEAAALTGIPPGRIEWLCRHEGLPHYRTRGGWRRILRPELMEYLAEQEAA